MGGRWSSTRGKVLAAIRIGVPSRWVTPGLVDEVLAEVDEGNTASVAVVKRLGMTPYAVVPGVLGPMTRYRATVGTG